MTIQIKLDEARRHRIISDDANPHLYADEWKCVGCQLWTDNEDIVWATADGILSTDHGLPWCTYCAPEELDYPAEKDS